MHLASDTVQLVMTHVPTFAASAANTDAAGVVANVIAVAASVAAANLDAVLLVHLLSALRISSVAVAVAVHVLPMLLLLLSLASFPLSCSFSLHVYFFVCV